MPTTMMAILAVASIALIVYSFWPSNKDDADAIKRRMSGRRAQDTVASLRHQAKESVAKKFMKSVAPIAVRPVMMNNPAEVSKLRMRLASAGFRGENVTTNFLSSKTFLAIGLAIVGGLYAWAKGSTTINGIGISLCAAGFGFLAPNLWLSMAISKRKTLLRNGLPDALDMMVISVESGLGLDSAVQRVGDELRLVHPALSEELQIVTLESQMGIPRAEALKNFAERSQLEEAQAIVGVVNQAERFGTSVGKALRNQSHALRLKRRQAAEERAQKTTVKLMAPLILFIFPAILVVLAGPAALKMYETLTDSSLTG